METITNSEDVTKVNSVKKITNNVSQKPPIPAKPRKIANRIAAKVEINATLEQRPVMDTHSKFVNSKSLRKNAVNSRSNSNDKYPVNCKINSTTTTTLECY